jgi:hypothetical protein
MLFSMLSISELLFGLRLSAKETLSALFLPLDFGCIRFLKSFFLPFAEFPRCQLPVLVEHSVDGCNEIA